MRNRRGSVLVVTLLVFTVLMILGIVTLNLAMAENNFSLNHQHKTQAYYVARAGVEAVETAILDMSEEELDELTEQLKEGTVNVDDILMDMGEASVSLSLDDESMDLTINSLGKFNTRTGREVKNTVTKVMRGNIINSAGLDIRHTVFSNKNITLESNATIVGNVGTNSYVILSQNSKIIGEIDILGGGDVEGKEGRHIGDINYGGMPIIYENFEFPEIPFNGSTYNLTINKYTVQEINTGNNYYNNIEITSHAVLIIDATIRDIILNVKNFSMGNSAEVQIKGNNKVVFNVENIDWNNASSIKNENGNGLVEVYYYGNNAISLNNKVEVELNLYIKEADLILNNKTDLIGNVFSNGNMINLNNTGHIHGLLYAPGAEINIENNGQFHGAIIGNWVNLTNRSHIEDDEGYIDDNIVPIVSHMGYNPGYYK